ncbi:MAG: HEAT repeat domain-containing protein [Candidatus Brocadiia bacterium]
MKRTVTIILGALLCWLAPQMGIGESNLRPPSPKVSHTATDPSPKASSTPKPQVGVPTVENSFARLSAAVASKDAAAALSTLTFLKLIGMEVAEPFRGAGFPARLSEAEGKAEEAFPGISRHALLRANSFIAIRSRLMVEGFSTDATLTSLAGEIPSAPWLCSSVALAEWFPEDTRIAALRCLLLLLEKGAEDIALAWMKGDNAALTLAAINYFGLAGNKEFAKIFSERAANAKLSFELRIEYALAAERLDASGIEVLRDILNSSPAPQEVRLRCIRALGALARDKSAPILLQYMLAETPDPLLLGPVINQLAEWKYEAIAPHLGRFIKAGDTQVQVAAIRAAGTLTISRLYPTIAEIMIFTSQAPVKTACIRTLSECAAAEYLPKIGEFLYDRDFSVRVETGLALQLLTGQDFGFIRNADAAENEAAIRKARVWWVDYKANLSKP